MNPRIIYYLFNVLLIGITLLSCNKENDTPGESASKIPPGNNLLYTYSDNTSYAGFLSNSPNYGIYTNSDTGGTQTPLIVSKSVAFYYPNWSNNDKIYFLSKYQGETKKQIYSINFDGTNVQRISKDTLTEYTTLDFSHINERFLYNKNTGGLRQLCSNNVQMNDEKVLLSGAVTASWGPNGNNIIYGNFEQNNSGQYIMNLYLMNADGTGQNKITSNTVAQLTYSTPFISPDGNKIVYTSTRERLVNNTNYISSLTDAYTCNIDGSNEVRITNSVPQSDFWFNANWAKDSKRVLLFHYGIRIPYTLHIYNTDDHSVKFASSSWVMIDANIKQF